MGCFRGDRMKQLSKRIVRAFMIILIIMGVQNVTGTQSSMIVKAAIVSPDNGKEVFAAAGLHSKSQIQTARKKLSSTKIFKKCSQCTVEIVASDQYSEALGSGFFIKGGKIVTNYHVIKGAKKIVVRTYDKQEYTVDTILGYDENIDLAVLQLDAGYNTLPISKKSASGGDEIYTFGSPLGLTGTMTKGMVSTPSRVIDGVNYVQIDASISHGNSGGPLVNQYGEVIGVNTMYFADGQNLNFAINIKELKKINTDFPISVDKYYETYQKAYQKWLLDNMIEEDSVASQKFSTSQEIPSDYLVHGTLVKSEDGDCYYFKVTEPGYFYGFMLLKNETDMKNTYFDLFKYTGDYICGCKEDSEDSGLTISKYLEPGEYEIVTSLPDGYTGSDIDYLFMLSYY